MLKTSRQRLRALNRKRAAAGGLLLSLVAVCVVLRNSTPRLSEPARASTQNTAAAATNVGAGANDGATGATDAQIPPAHVSLQTAREETVKRYTARDAQGKCLHKRFLGDQYGGWFICEPKSANAFQGALVYTIGVGRNIEWDKAMMRTFGTVHHGYDPTPRAVDYITNYKNLPPNFVFHKYGLGVKDGTVMATLPVGNTDSYTISSFQHAQAQKGKETAIEVLTLESMIRKASHTNLAILKMDVEGIEFDVIRSWYKSGYSPPAEQVLIEFHERYFKGDKSLVSMAIGQMRELGFEVFHKTNLELSFIRV